MSDNVLFPEFSSTLFAQVSHIVGLVGHLVELASRIVGPVSHLYQLVSHIRETFEQRMPVSFEYRMQIGVIEVG